MHGKSIQKSSSDGPDDLSFDLISMNQSQDLLPESLKRLVPTYDIYKSLRSKLETRDGKIPYPTGLTELDNLMWGLPKGELMTVGARTSQGKSVFSLEAAKNLAMNGQSVLYLSLEMSKEALVERLLCNMCQIDNRDLLMGRAWEQVVKKEAAFVSWLKDARLVIDDYNGYRFKAILELVEHFNFDFVIVDYVQMISTQGFKDKLSALEDFVKEIRREGKRKGYGTILISQLNRTAALQDRPYMHQLKNAGILEEHSSVVLLLHYDFSQEPHKYTIYVEKNSNGNTGKVGINFIPQYYKMEDLNTPIYLDREPLRKDLV
jgi:replicative DNA helicase